MDDLEAPVGAIPPVADLPAKELSKLHLEWENVYGFKRIHTEADQ